LKRGGSGFRTRHACAKGYFKGYLLPVMIRTGMTARWRRLNW
jgi:hypothetical protein